MFTDKTSILLTVVTGLWLVAVGSGLILLLQYSYRPGAVGAAPHVWPAGTQLKFVNGAPNFVMFLHPKCPCSRASVREFEEIMARCKDMLHAQVVFVRPTEVSDEWVKDDLWHAATAIPRVVVSIDNAGSAIRLGR